MKQHVIPLWLGEATEGSPTQRWQRVQLRKRAMARFYSGLVLQVHSRGAGHGHPEGALSGPLFEMLAWHTPTAE